MSSLSATRTTTPTARPLWLADLPVLLAALFWGASFLAAKGVTTGATVLAVLVLRFGLVLPVLLIVGRRGLRALRPAQLRTAALLGLVLAVIFVLETYGVVHTSATNAGLIISLTMILTPLAESALRRTVPSPAFLAAALLSVLGVALLTQSGGFTAPGLGDLLILAAACARTVHVLLMSRATSLRGADDLSLTTVQLGTSLLLFTALFAVPGAGLAPWTAAAAFDAADWAGLVFLSLCCTLYAFFVQMWAVRRTSASRVSLLMGTEPLFAAAVGLTLAGDEVGPLGILGAVLVLLGTAWGRRAAAS
ncbi:DMT family transporter [Streptomyces sp. BI20]|uniref:DMT family transporter n=1 Tax=Streptomyces sp. BI20 TaxID=3403460 RepID=UPI003C78634B